MSSNSNVIKQNALELIKSLRDNSKENIVNDIAGTSTDIQRDIVDYFNRPKDVYFDKEYYLALNTNTFEHQCVKWRDVPTNRSNKRLKPAENIPGYSLRKPGKPLEKSKQNLSKFVNPPEFSRSKSMPDNSAGSSKTDDDTLSEAIVNLKGDVKCLMNIMKTEKLTAKNVSDLKIIANQLLSLM